MTEEKARALVEYLEADEEKAKALFELSAAEAAEKLTADGVKCTENDLVEFAKAVQTASQSQDGELDEDALSEVAGGVMLGVAYKVAKLLFKAGYIRGRWLG